MGERKKKSMMACSVQLIAKAMAHHSKQAKGNMKMEFDTPYRGPYDWPKTNSFRIASQRRCDDFDVC